MVVHSFRMHLCEAWPQGARHTHRHIYTYTHTHMHGCVVYICPNSLIDFLFIERICRSVMVYSSICCRSCSCCSCSCCRCSCCRRKAHMPYEASLLDFELFAFAWANGSRVSCLLETLCLLV